MGAPYRGVAGILGIGVPATAITSYGTSINASNVFHVDGFGEANTATTFDRRTLAAGVEEGLGMSTLEGNKTVSFSGPVCDISFPILWALALGTDTISTIAASTGRQHLCTPVAVDAELPQCSLYFKQTAVADITSIGSIAYHGCVLDSLTLTGSAGGIWTYTATFCTTGTGAATTTTMAGLTAPNVLPFRFGNTQFSTSSTTPTAVTMDSGTESTAQSGGTGWTFTNLGTLLRGQTFAVNNNCQMIYTAADTSGLATTTVRGARVTGVSSRFLMDNTAPVRTWVASVGASILTHGLATRCVSSSAAGTSCNYGWQILIPKAQSASVDVDKTLGAREITINHTVVDSNQSGIKTIYAAGWNVATTAYTP